MRFDRRFGVVLLAASLVAPAQSPAPQKSAKPGHDDPRKFGATFAENQAPEFAWLMFLNLNMPAKAGVRGVPDRTKSVGAPGATVWETFKNVADIYLSNGLRPTPWSNMDEWPGSPHGKLAATKQQLAALGPVDSTWIHYLAEDRMIDGQNIITDVSSIVRYDVRANKDTFDYIVNNPSKFELFNLDGQEAALASSTFTFNFPQPAMEVKASWRILGPNDDPSRYWTAYAYYYDLENRLQLSRVGLTGLHFTSKILPNWFWATFEQTDNATATYRYHLMKKGDPVGPNPTFNPKATELNKSWDQALQGTKWQYYKLMGWQINFVEPSGSPTLLGNTQMETYFEKNSSCMTCHSIANIGPPSAYRLSFWNMANGDFNGYTGNLNFQQLAQQQYPGLTFKQMDFVWSMRQAKPKQVVPGTPAIARRQQ